MKILLSPFEAVSDIDSVSAAIFDKVVIAFSILNFNGSAVLNKLNFGLDVIIIDEATQALKPATIVTLFCGCNQAFFIGSLVQLLATVSATIAKKFGSSTSLSKRFQWAGCPAKMLKIKYRMNSEIRNFPTKEFYGEAQDKVAKFSSHVLLVELQHGSVVIAVIASCMNSSNPNVMHGASVVKKRAGELGLRVKP
ncbi:hypothetical protein CRYUN_Cryun03dG0037200 [Craigia yunnanensis]